MSMRLILVAFHFHFIGFASGEHPNDRPGEALRGQAQGTASERKIPGGARPCTLDGIARRRSVRSHLGIPC
jgi:hypothetical protein